MSSYQLSQCCQRSYWGVWMSECTTFCKVILPTLVYKRQHCDLAKWARIFTPLFGLWEKPSGLQSVCLGVSFNASLIILAGVMGICRKPSQSSRCPGIGLAATNVQELYSLNFNHTEWIRGLQDRKGGVIYRRWCCSCYQSSGVCSSGSYGGRGGGNRPLLQTYWGRPSGAGVCVRKKAIADKLHNINHPPAFLHFLHITESAAEGR